MSVSQPEIGQAVPGVLHVVPANGGGVDRVVRDLCGKLAGRCQD